MSAPTNPTLTDDLASVRSQFPALAADPSPICLDNPAGTQVPRRVISAIAGYLQADNANTHGSFGRSERTDQTVHRARAATATLLGASDPGEIVFGPNMTSLTFAFSRALGADLEAGDEVIVSDLDHDANIAPWLALRERGVQVRRIPLAGESCTLDYEAFERLLQPRTRLVAVGLASNVAGTVNDIARISAAARSVGAWTWVDAVHFAPHGLIDVAALGADFLVCSAYKFFGPHVAALWGRAELLERIAPYQVRPAPKTAPEKFETGTKNHECLSGLFETVRYLESLAPSTSGAPPVGEEPQREHIVRAMHRVTAYEAELSRLLVCGLSEIPGVQLYGLGEDAIESRVPTVACTIAGVRAADAASRLARLGVCAWGGHHYAPQLIECLGLAEAGGVLRLGAVHYNTPGEIERAVDAVASIARGD